jgi:hypothetical protein
MSVQKDWASCPKCQGMHFAGFRIHDPANGFEGACPADHQQHTHTNSFLYELLFDVGQDAHLQGGWSACPKCQGLYFSGFPFQGFCPAGESHINTNSFKYVLKHDLPSAPGFQIEWRSCSKCLGLYFGPFGGKCPKDGAAHDPARSFNYGIDFQPSAISPRFFFREVSTALEVDMIGNGFTAFHQVHIAYGFQIGPDNTFPDPLDVAADNNGDFEQRVSIPSNAFNIQGRATDTFTNTSADSPILRPSV